MPARPSVRVLRQWAGLCDMTPDFSPIMGNTPVEGFLVDVGWGTYGFKAGPVSGEAMAQCIASGKPPEIIAPFGLDRFADRRARWREGRGRGRALSGKVLHDPPALPLVRAA